MTPGDDFCGTCGAFLDWSTATDTPAPAPRPTPAPPKEATATPAPRPEPTDPDEPTGPPAPQPRTARPDGTGLRPTSAPPDEPTDTPAPRPEPTEPEPATDTSAPGPEPAEPDGSTAGKPVDPVEQARSLGRAAALVVPVRPAEEADPQVGPTVDEPPVEESRPDQPGAVQPGRPVAPAPVVRDFTGDRVDDPTDVTCLACAARNPYGRSFCRRCGRPLAADAAPTTAVPWWRRIRWPRRRSGGGLVRRLLAVLLVLALVAGLIWAGVRFLPPLIETIRDRTATPEAILPDEVTASSAARNHPAASAVDGLNNRYWAPATDRPAVGEYVELAFDRPIRLLDLIVHTGASPRQDDFVEQPRPAELTLTLVTSDGTSSTVPLRLTDRPGPQAFHHVAGDVTRMRLTIASVYGQREAGRVALAEVEVFRRP
ncbi:NADase-type glycan-binding domain-containing protein [Micromonospora sp. SH-82]|uniref:NADase-type glycan-binding domain-containing protein n=1 Tax=Micromonospora sp. SH-82 TaxID=3132938 RepID=UPI003EC07ED3